MAVGGAFFSYTIILSISIHRQKSPKVLYNKIQKLNDIITEV